MDKPANKIHGFHFLNCQRTFQRLRNPSVIYNIYAQGSDKRPEGVPMSEKSQCDGCSNMQGFARDRKSWESAEQYQERMTIAERMSRIKHKVLVMSGKGGVGKTTVAVNLSIALAVSGKSVGLMDIDIHGPNVPNMIGVPKSRVYMDESKIMPLSILPKLKVMSIAFFLDEDSDAVIWRGPMKMSLIKQFLKDVDWGDLDFLIIDAPPGTGDEPLSVVQLLDDLDGALIVTTPQDISLIDVRKSITFCRQLHMHVLGIVENMSGFICPHCQEGVDIFKSGGGEKLAAEMGVPFLGKVPIDQEIVQQSDRGDSVMIKKPEGEIAKAFKEILAHLEKNISNKAD
jgi:Mrp family chromosome partitioning ATPase